MMSLPVSGPIFFLGWSPSGVGVCQDGSIFVRIGSVRSNPPNSGRAGSTHPIGMLSCFVNIIGSNNPECASLLFSYFQVNQQQQKYLLSIQDEVVSTDIFSL